MNTRSLLLLFTIILVTTISVSAQPVQMEVVPTSLEFLNGPASQTISLHFSSISESVSWWVTTQDDSANWFTVTPDSGNGSEETVQLTVSIHSYEFPFEIFDLPGEVVIHGMNTTPDTITIPILLHFLGFTDPGSVDENWMATPYSIHLLNINDSLTWTATTSSNWFTVHPDSGIGSNWITGAISENDSISSRRGCIVIGFNFTHPRIDTVWVTQGGRIPCQLTVSPTSWTINDYHAASHTFQINDGGGTMIPDWNIPYDASWITCTPWHGIGNDIITALADENPDSAGRTATITIIDNHSVPDTVMITVFQPGTYISNVNYRDIDFPTQFAIRKVYPNPFNSSTSIQYDLPIQSNITLDVVNVSGQIVMSLVRNTENAGYHNVTLNGSSLSSGGYFIRMMVAGKMNQIRRIELIK